jgi:hypothetical protein
LPISQAGNKEGNLLFKAFSQLGHDRNGVPVERSLATISTNQQGSVAKTWGIQVE